MLNVANISAMTRCASHPACSPLSRPRYDNDTSALFVNKVCFQKSSAVCAPEVVSCLCSRSGQLSVHQKSSAVCAPDEKDTEEKDMEEKDMEEKDTEEKDMEEKDTEEKDRGERHRGERHGG
ncbi:hypothetical protein ACOMHN_016438 [Nucella lapillus]